jgi:hypothetical protein
VCALCALSSDGDKSNSATFQLGFRAAQMLPDCRPRERRTTPEPPPAFAPIYSPPHPLTTVRPLGSNLLLERLT